MFSNRTTKIGLRAMKGKAGADGSAQVGYLFDDSGAMNRGPEGTRWSKLPKGADLAALQSDEFAFGTRLRLALDPSSKRADAVSVWSATSDTFVGHLAKSCETEVATWLRSVGAHAFITCEFWEGGQRASLGILAMPAEGFEIVLNGEPPASATDRLAQIEKDRQAILRAIPKFGSTLAKAEDKGITRASAEKLFDVVDEFEAGCDELSGDAFDADKLLALLTEFGFPIEGIRPTPELAAALNDRIGSVSASLSDVIEDWEDMDSDEREDARDNAVADIMSFRELLDPSSEGQEPVQVAVVAEAVIEPAAPVATPVQVPAAWYDDPTTAGQWRYWDGAAWTEHVSPK